jgi:hypothetical protein
LPHTGPGEGVTGVVYVIKSRTDNASALVPALRGLDST